MQKIIFIIVIFTIIGVINANTAEEVYEQIKVICAYMYNYCRRSESLQVCECKLLGCLNDTLIIANNMCVD